MRNDCLLQQILESAYMVLYCRAKETASVHPGYNPMDATVGEMDWVANLAMLREEINVRSQFTTSRG